MDYQTNPGSYGKRPLWQWIVLYVVVGGAIYGVVYYFFFAKNGNGYGLNAPATGQAQDQQQSQTQPSASQQPAQTAPVTQSSTPAPQSFTVNGNDTSADLTTITVPEGTPVSITFGADVNGTYHGGLDFRSSVVNTGTIVPGSTKTVSFTARRSFSFTPYWPSTNIAKPYKINVVVE